MTDEELIERLRWRKESLDAAAADRIEALVKALRWYSDKMCEGFCGDLPSDSTYTPEMDEQCSGCKARATIAGAKS